MQGIDLQRKSKELLTELDKDIKNNLEQYISEFERCFLDYCDKVYEMQQEGKKKSIAYIQFSVLRTNILLNKHVIRMDAYDENWYLDTAECNGEYEVTKYYSYLKKYGECIEDLRKKALGGITLAEVQKRIFSESNFYLFYVAEVIRLGMRKVIQSQSYKRMQKADCFMVTIGGYMDRFDILYKEDTTQKDAKEVKRYLQSGSQKVFSHAFYEDLDLTNGHYERLEFQYSSFSGCDLSNSYWDNTHLVFSKFRKVTLKEAKMEKMKIFDTDFSGAVMENISFAGSKMRYVSFEGASLRGVDFSKTLVFEEINFEGAVLTDCKLPERG